MATSHWVTALAGSLLAGSFAVTAYADPPHVDPLPQHAAAPAKPFLAPAPRPHVPAIAATVIQPPAAPIKPAVVLPTNKAQAGAKRAPDAAAPAVPAFQLKPESSDPGIKILAMGGNRIVLRGVAAGPKVKYLEGLYFENGKRVQPVDYQVARGVSFQVDHDKMPDFSQDDGYTRKNAWYFAHLATTGTEQGDTASTVAQRLAASLNKGGAYRATVEPTDDGGAAINLEKL